jgi:signal recognition particle subunit SRP54
MFDTLSEKLQAAFNKLRRPVKLSEADLDEALKEIRLALLEADVNFRVVKDFIARVREKSVGIEVLDGLNAGQQVIKIVHDEMVALLAGDSGGDQAPTLGEHAPSALNLEGRPAVIMLCGLQGAGKTTLAGKLALYLKKQGRTPVLAACDVQRPAAVQQLEIVGKQVDVPVFAWKTATPVAIAKEAIDYALVHKCDTVILDTAGRLHVDDALMEELKAIVTTTHPSEILLVLDAMTGQDAVNVAREFDAAIGVNGFVLTKIDGDARGGAAISVRSVVGKPIKLLGVGEKMDALEPFFPDRMASRILGMGDVLTLIERAAAAVDEKKSAEIEKKMRAGKFDFDDFLSQMQQMKRLGPMENLLKLIPGVGPMLKEVDFSVGEKKMARFEAIVRSMTTEERQNPEIISKNRRNRIAKGAGMELKEVNDALAQFDQMKMLMQMLSGGKMPSIPGMSQPRYSKNVGGTGGARATKKAISAKKGKKNGPDFTPFGR